MRSLKLVFVILLLVGSLQAVTVFTETFSNSVIPSGWHVAGSENYDKTLNGAGIAKTVNDFFYDSQTSEALGYLRLTENPPSNQAQSYQRGWAYYTDSTFRFNEHWRMDMIIRIGKPGASQLPAENDGGDGFTISFVDASTVETAGVFDPAKVVGGYGTFLGAARGTNEGYPNNSGNLGYVAGLKGFAFAFDHFDSSYGMNHETDPRSEMLKWMKLDNWTDTGISVSTLGDQTFYYNNGFIRVQLEGQNGEIVCRYGWNGSTYTQSQSFDISDPNRSYDFDAYLGVTASTGGYRALHDISFLKLEDLDPTLPVTLDSFYGCVANGNQINLQWITQTETNVLGYKIYRGTEPNLSTALQLDTFIPATNSSQTQAYIFSDTELVEDGTYYYWLQNLDMDGSSEYHGPVQIALNTFNQHQTPPSTLVTGIRRAYPNPFNPDITISYELDRAGFTELKIYNLRGQMVRDLYQGSQNRGSHSVLWNGRDDQNNTCSSGTYILVLKAGTQTFNHRLILSK